MCGIVAVLGSPRGLDPPPPDALLKSLTTAVSALPGPSSDFGMWAGSLAESATDLQALNAPLRSSAGVRLLVAEEGLCRDLAAVLDRADSRLGELEARLDEVGEELDTATLETINSGLVRSRDLIWALARDRIGHADRVRSLAGGASDPAVVAGLSTLEVVMSALDRLEVRGRDSAGVHVFVDGCHASGLNVDLGELLTRRELDPLFTSGAVRRAGDESMSFAFKAAAEIGELGDNGRRLRREIADDRLLATCLEAGSGISVLGHTRWASVGVISEANAHPLNHEEAGGSGPYVVAALNGDVDNYQELLEAESLRLPAEITTDAKVIPVLMSRRLGEGHSLEEAFRSTVASFRGSVAIAAQSAVEPDRLLLALRGSGQALYVGLLDGAFVVASEPYGLVEQTSRYLRLDGETPGNPDSPEGSRGQIVILDRRAAGSLAGIRRVAYDGTELPVSDDEIQRAEITTRDIDRGDFPHFLLKEIHQAPASFRKTLRGKIRPVGDGGWEVRLGPEILPADVVAALRAGDIRRLVVIGQGTAAIAGRAVARALGDLLPENGVRVESLPATELSGFALRQDMSDTLVLAISQSGTTTDTNRTVDLVRARGARVIAVVNRRGADLVDKADGVLYTSDGRDIENLGV
ncbi:MAG: SIS domain-containing protein, partial [Thermoanaerobaculia bacterium]|nr:SIS domain-containing protein [Thermoanaerobaculia bacterium]